MTIPEDQDELVRLYSLSERDISIITQKRGAANQLGFAVQLCCMRFPGRPIRAAETPPLNMLRFVSNQLGVQPDLWHEYADRDQTRREHIVELQEILGYRTFSLGHYNDSVQRMRAVSERTDQGIALAQALVESLQRDRVLLPSTRTIERICSEGLTLGTRLVYERLTSRLTAESKRRLDALLEADEGRTTTTINWLLQQPGPLRATSVLSHIARLKAIEGLELPSDATAEVHQNRLLKLSREGSRMTAQHLGELEDTRRYATLMAVVHEARATIVDEIIDLHERFIGRLLNRAKRKHEQQFQKMGKAINDKVRLYCRLGRAILEAKESGRDPFSAIEAVIPWTEFAQSIEEADTLAERSDPDFLHRIGDGYSQVRRYAPAFLDALTFHAAPAAREILAAVDILRELNHSPANNKGRLPEDSPTGFIRSRWRSLVIKETGLDRRFYELCTLAELKNALRSGDMWVEGSRQFRDFNDYLIPTESFVEQNRSGQLPLPIDCMYESHLSGRLSELASRLKTVDQLAATGRLPDASISPQGLKIAPLSTAIPTEAEELTRMVYGLLPHVKITDLLMEVDQWTGMSRHFTHLKSGATALDTSLLLTVILSDAINLGLAKMAESCPGTSYRRLAWLQAWHIRDETYSAALAEVVNAQLKIPFARNWGDGTVSSSDGQNFRAAGRAEATGHHNPKYGSHVGLQFYTHVSDQYTPFHTKVINSPVRDATHALDGLLYHESDMKIEEHCTDTAGFTDHVFALMHLLGYRFAPRIRDLADKRLYTPERGVMYETLSPLIGGPVNLQRIRMHWDEILRLAASIKTGTVTASLILRKLGGYPRQNGLAGALKELGKVERSIWMLDWFLDPELRQHVTAELNKGESRNALARAVAFNRLGEMRDRNLENQRYRASGLSLVTASIVLWNTVYMSRAVETLRKHSHVDDDLLQYLSPLGWGHINLTGDYSWRANRNVKNGRFRPLRTVLLA